MAEITESKNFIHAFIEEDIAEGGRYAGQTVHTRFPPEPNGYLHIGHCKALIIDFGTAEKFGGLCNLRMDDTNPTKEDVEFVEAIKEDIHWLGFDWGDRFYYGSDYFEKDYEYAVELIKKGLAYVCELNADEMRDPKYCGDVSRPAVSPWRDRPIEESLDLFERMKNGALYNLYAQERTTMDPVVADLAIGSCVLFFPGRREVLTFFAGSEDKRSIGQPDNEPSIKGARDSFVESVRTNTSLVRRRLRSP